jgi:hypothetical protein
LSLKYQKKIMEAYLFKDKKSVFVMSFTGRWYRRDGVGMMGDIYG